MAHDDKLKRDVRRKFVFERQALATIAVGLTASESTLRRWKREAKEAGDDWDVARAAQALAGEGLEAVVAAVIEDFVVLYQAAIQSVKEADQMEPAERVKLMASLADAFNKTISAAGRVSPKISELGVAMDVLRRLAEFTRERFPREAEALLVVLEPFGEHLAGVYQA